MQPARFAYDVFISYSTKDIELVLQIAERLTNDGLTVWLDAWRIKPGDSIPAKIEEGLEASRVLVLCMSQSLFGSDWTQLEFGTFRFRDPLNKDRRFIPLRVDESPLRASLAHFSYVPWNNGQGYPALLESCMFEKMQESLGTINSQAVVRSAKLGAHSSSISAAAFSPCRTKVATGTPNESVHTWDVRTGSEINAYLPNVSNPFKEDVPLRAITSISWSNLQNRFVTLNSSKVARIWDVEMGHRVKTFDDVLGVLPTENGNVFLHTSDRQFLYCDALTGRVRKRGSLYIPHAGDLLWINGLDMTALFESRGSILSISYGATHVQLLGKYEGHSGQVTCAKACDQERFILTGSSDRTLRLWDKRTLSCLRVLEGHTGGVACIDWCQSGRYAVSASRDKTIRLWDIEHGRCIGVFDSLAKDMVSIAWGGAFGNVTAITDDGWLIEWDLSNFMSSVDIPKPIDEILYTNAKVLVVGETHSGKTGLAHRLATDQWKPSEDSTVGTWSTQWLISGQSNEPGISREIWLWDFGGQADQRLVHQLYMDKASLILLLFNADQEDVLNGLRDWVAALRRVVSVDAPYILIAGRVDTGFKASREKLMAFAEEQGMGYFETSAKSGEGCDLLRAAMIDSIPWSKMEKHTSPRLFKLIKDEILKLRDEGLVLHTFKELRELLWRRLPDEPRFSDETLQTVISLLDGPGVVTELDYGTYTLLAPEWINAYAQAVIRTLRSVENDLGALPIRSISEGRLIYQSVTNSGETIEMKRLPPADERVVLGEMERQLELRGLCLRQGDKLVFPSHCGRDRPEVKEHPSVFVSYIVKGYLDDIYATLVVKLADSESFLLKELWRDAADFVTLSGEHHMGLKMARKTGVDGEISIYFGPGVTQSEQVIFANYINLHLAGSCEQSKRLRHYVCPFCHCPKGNAQVLMEKLLKLKKSADTECDRCGERFPLWDALEKQFASAAIRQSVEGLQESSRIKLDSRRKGKLLVLEVESRITSADQKCFEIPSVDDEGIDMELEFTNDEGRGTGHRLYLQLKSGNSHLTKRKDGREIFRIAEQRWVKYWLSQPYPVMLVIGTFADERQANELKHVFEEVRWMEISSVLRRLTEDGSKQVKQFEFKGERMDMTSVRSWRERILNTRVKLSQKCESAKASRED